MAALMWTGAEIQRLFQSRSPPTHPKGQGIFGWLAALVAVEALELQLYPYDGTPTDLIKVWALSGGRTQVEDLTKYRRAESREHIQLTEWARIAFQHEEQGSSPDMLGYGTADWVTAQRVVECGVTPPVKILRAWAIGFTQFTLFPFEQLHGHRYANFKLPATHWPLKPPHLRKKRRSSGGPNARIG